MILRDIHANFKMTMKRSVHLCNGANREWANLKTAKNNTCCFLSANVRIKYNHERFLMKFHSVHSRKTMF